MIWALLAACLLAAIPAGLRWLRVAQREHYLAGAVATFAGRWWTSGLPNVLLLALAVIGLVGSWWSVWWAFLVPLAQLGPIGSVDPWPHVAARLDGAAASVWPLSPWILMLAVYVGGAAVESGFFIALGLFLLPALIDIALLVLGPIERIGGQSVGRPGISPSRILGGKGRGDNRFLRQDDHQAVRGRIILAGRFRTVASPASFNNRMGLARAINEHLVPGTEVFVAEMGTYGPGEIEELTRWIRPDVAAMVAIGPVHLERFRTLERIVAAKSEILDRARVGVIAVDHPLLAGLAAERGGTMEVVTVSGDGADARVTVHEGVIRIDGTEVGNAPEDVFAVNLAVALGIGLALGVEPGDMVSRLGRASPPGASADRVRARNAGSPSSMTLSTRTRTGQGLPSVSCRGLEMVGERSW